MFPQNTRALPASAVTFDEMNGALESALEHDGWITARIEAVLAIPQCAAGLTATDANSRGGQEGYISTPQELTVELMKNSGLYAGATLSGASDEDTLLGLSTLALVASVDVSAAGVLAGELPDLTGDDPRIEPAARQRALRWVADTLALTNGTEPDELAHAHTGSDDARIVLAAAAADSELVTEWPIRRLAAAAGHAAAALLAAFEPEDPELAIEVFVRPGGVALPGM